MSSNSSIHAISPVDGRYQGKTEALSIYFSECALIKYRVQVEVEYFIALCEFDLPQLSGFPISKFDALRDLYRVFSDEDAEKVKSIEAVTNHDVKAVEYFIKEAFEQLGISQYSEFIHFGLTSQDINNTAFPLMISNALNYIIIPELETFIEGLTTWYHKWKEIPMLARTHGQPASPTSLGKEMMVYVERLQVQVDQLKSSKIKVKFGGATGNLNAHKVSYPNRDWRAFANSFTTDALGLDRSQFTTQIAHYDSLAQLMHTLERVNTICIDFCRDMWTYISMEYFRQKVVANEVGSSAMPHKVNPIDFENAEGNFGMANAVFQFLAAKLPISRLQRDLTDSTVLRNVGVPFAHTLIALKSVQKGAGKILINKVKISEDLDKNWAVVAEAIQNILRREGFEKPYEALKALTRGNHIIDQSSIQVFINQLDISEEVKAELRIISPHNYFGYN